MRKYKTSKLVTQKRAYERLVKEEMKRRENESEELTDRMGIEGEKVDERG